MATITLENIPDVIVRELQDRATHFNRPIPDEARSILMHAIATERWRSEMTAEDLLERADAIRNRSPNAYMTEEWLRHAKNEGRL